MLNVFVHLFITLFLCLMYPYIVLCIYVFILVRKLHPLSHLLALFFSFSPTYTKNNALKTEVYSEKATPINCYPPIATSHVSGPSGLLLSSLLTWLILAILYCNRPRLRVKRKNKLNWIELWTLYGRQILVDSVFTTVLVRFNWKTQQSDNSGLQVAKKRIFTPKLA